MGGLVSVKRRRHPPAKERILVEHVARGMAVLENRRDDLVRRLKWRWKWLALVAAVGWALAAAAAWKLYLEVNP